MKKRIINEYTLNFQIENKIISKKHYFKRFLKFIIKHFLKMGMVFLFWYLQIIFTLYFQIYYNFGLISDTLLAFYGTLFIISLHLSYYLFVYWSKFLDYIFSMNIYDFHSLYNLYSIGLLRRFFKK